MASPKRLLSDLNSVLVGVAMGLDDVRGTNVPGQILNRDYCNDGGSVGTVVEEVRRGCEASMNSEYKIADARDLSRIVKAGSVQLTITSPPYADMKDYGHLKNQIGFGQTYETYIQDIENVFRQVYDASADTSSLWVVVNTFRQAGRLRMLPFEMARVIETAGWIPKDVAIWHKAKTLPWSRKGQMRDLFEYVLFFSKTEDYKYYVERVTDPLTLRQWWVKYPERYGAFGKVPDNIWEFPIPTQGSWSNIELRHACPFPLALVERIVDLCSDEGDLILDPFAGSGTVLAQANCMGRRYVGLDLNKHYQEMFYQVVVPDAERRWAASEPHRRALDQRRQDLAMTIPHLRQVKYPKHLLRQLHKLWRHKASFPDIQAVFAIGQDTGFMPSKRKYLAETVYVMVDGERCGEKKRVALLRALEYLAERPPISKYGIEATLRVITNGEHIQGHCHSCLDAAFYLYPRGRVWRTERAATMSQWIQEIRSPDWFRNRNGTPPILCNIQVNHKPISASELGDP